jgi:hypothetical protein
MAWRIPTCPRLRGKPSVPAAKSWGQIGTFVRDKDGIIVELCSHSTQS